MNREIHETKLQESFEDRLMEDARNTFRQRIELKVTQCLTEQHLLTAGQNVLVACSGGPDSMALLHILASIGTQQNFKVGAVCVNHNLRESASAEVEMVKTQASMLNVPLFTFSENVVGYAAKKKMSTETAGRELRYEKFRETARLHGYDVIALAHHQGDQAETVMAHLMRGAGAAGLRGMDYKRGDIIRPLLDFSKGELIEFLLSEHIPYALDETNNEPIYERNRIRLELLPLMETFNPRVQRSLCKMAKLQGEEDDFMEDLASTWVCRVLLEDTLSEERGERIVDGITMRTIPLVLRRRVWRRLTEPFYADGHAPSYSTIESLEGLLASDSGEKQFFVKKMKVYRKYDKIYFVSPAVKSVSAKLSSEYRPTWSPITLSDSDMPKMGTFIVPASYQNSLQVRTRREGDIIVLTDRQGRVWGHKKLKKYIMEKKIPRNERDEILWLTSGPIVFCEARCNRSFVLREEECAEYIMGRFEEEHL